MEPLAGTVFPRVAVTIILAVVLTVAGSKLIIKPVNKPGIKLTVPETSAAEVSAPIVAKNEPVTSAGDGFLIPVIITSILSIASAVGIALVIVILFAVVLTVHVYPVTETYLTLTPAQD